MLSDIESIAQVYIPIESNVITEMGCYEILIKIKWLQIESEYESLASIPHLLDLIHFNYMKITYNFILITLFKDDDIIFLRNEVKYESYIYGHLTKIHIEFCKIRQITKEKNNKMRETIDV